MLEERVLGCAPEIGTAIIALKRPKRQTGFAATLILRLAVAAAVAVTIALSVALGLALGLALALMAVFTQSPAIWWMAFLF